MKKSVALTASLIIPSVAYAQTLTQINNANQLEDRLLSLADVAIYLLVSLAVLYIVWSTVQYFIKGKSGDESRKEAGMDILWGIVGLAIIVSIWGLVNIIVNTFSTNNRVPTDRFPNANFLSRPY